MSAVVDPFGRELSLGLDAKIPGMLRAQLRVVASELLDKGTVGQMQCIAIGLASRGE